MTPPTSLSFSVGTWVTFGGQITDEVRADGFFHQSGVGNGNPPYDLAYAGLLKKPIFTYSIVTTYCQREPTAGE